MVRRSRMRRTQVCLGDTDYQIAMRLAAQQRVSLAEVVRRALRQYGTTTLVRGDEELKRRFFSVVGTGRSGDRRASVDHDRVIYGGPVRRR